MFNKSEVAKLKEEKAQLIEQVNLLRESLMDVWSETSKLREIASTNDIRGLVVLVHMKNTNEICEKALFGERD